MRITLYTSPNCPHCRKAKKFFEKHHLDYQEVGVPKNWTERNVLDKFAGQVENFRGVPVIVLEVGGQKHIFESINDWRFQKILDQFIAEAKVGAK